MSFFNGFDPREPMTFNQRAEVLWGLGAIAFLIFVVVVNNPGLAVFLILGFVIYCLRRTKPKVDSASHGSARFAERSDLSSAGCLKLQEGFLIGQSIDLRKSSRKPIEIVVPDWRFPHISVIGPSGTGKSTCFSIANLRSRDPAGCIALDPKGELARESAAWRAQNLGHEIVIIDPYRISGLNQFKCGRINPLRLQDSCSKLIADDARRLANALVVRTSQEREPFWPNSAQALIQCMTTFLMSEAKPEKANLNHLRDILTNSESTQEILEYMYATDNCHGLLRRMAGQVMQWKGQTAASVFGVANSHLEFLDSVPVAEILSDTDFDPMLLLQNRMTLYLCLPVDRIMEMRGLQRILVTSLVNFVFQAGESKSRRVRLMLDEAASLGEIDALYNAVMFGRGFGLRATLFFQSASQIAQCFPESKAADYKGTVATVFSGVNDFVGAEEVSKWIGQTTVTSSSSQYSSNYGNSSSQNYRESQTGYNSGSSNSFTQNQIGRPLIQAEELLQLPPSIGIALLPSIPPILFEKVPYFARLKPKHVKKIRRVSMLNRSALAILIALLTCAAVAVCQVIAEQRTGQASGL